MIVLGHDGFGKLRLDGRCEVVVNSDKTVDKEKKASVQYFRRLRTVSPEYITLQTRKIRMFCNEDEEEG